MPNCILYDAGLDLICYRHRCIFGNIKLKIIRPFDKETVKEKSINLKRFGKKYDKIVFDYQQAT
jgi:hypothetical protein